MEALERFIKNRSLLFGIMCIIMGIILFLLGISTVQNLIRYIFILIFIIFVLFSILVTYSAYIENRRSIDWFVVPWIMSVFLICTTVFLLVFFHFFPSIYTNNIEPDLNHDVYPLAIFALGVSLYYFLKAQFSTDKKLDLILNSVNQPRQISPEPPESLLTPVPLLARTQDEGSMTVEWKKSIRKILIPLLWWLGYILMIIGFIFGVSGAIDPGLGAIAIGLGAVALSYSWKTDELVNSLKNLNFYEKMAEIAGYVIPLVKENDPNKLINLLFILKYDLKAITAISDRISPEQKNEFHDEILQTIVPFIQATESQVINLPEGNQRNISLKHIQAIKENIVQIYGKDVWKK